MSKIIFKRNMNIGDLSAENDDEFLRECFISTPEYKEISDFSNKKMILLGRTGSGKTALLKKLKDESAVFIEINPDTFAMEYITNVPFVVRLKNEDINLDAFYKFLWLHEIISKIIKAYLPENDWSASGLISFFSTTSQDKKKLQMFKEYLDKYEGKWFHQDFPETVTKEMENNLVAKINVKTIGELNGTISEKEKKEFQSEANQYVNKEQIQQLVNVIELLKDYFKNNQQRKITVAIDNLDEEWIDDESKYKLINALLTAIRYFASMQPLKIIIALRADLLTKTCLVTNRQNEKDESFTVKLDWTKQMIKQLLDERIEYLFKHKYTRQGVSFEEVFNCDIKGENASDYILNRTMMRPRDAINFVNICIRTADNSPKISSEHILNAEEDFRRERLSALCQEWHNIYRQLEIYIRSVYEIGDEFNYSGLISNYTQIENTLYKAPTTDDDDLINKFLCTTQSQSHDKENNLKELVKILFQVGVVGTRRKNNEVQYCTPYKSYLTELDFTDDLALVIHPLFKKA
jgi:hypothetical protein